MLANFIFSSISSIFVSLRFSFFSSFSSIFVSRHRVHPPVAMHDSAPHCVFLLAARGPLASASSGSFHEQIYSLKVLVFSILFSSSGLFLDSPINLFCIFIVVMIPLKVLSPLNAASLFHSSAIAIGRDVFKELPSVLAASLVPPPVSLPRSSSATSVSGALALLPPPLLLERSGSASSLNSAQSSSSSNQSSSFTFPTPLSERINSVAASPFAPTPS